MADFYKEEEIALSYDEKRFTGQGGRIIEKREKENVFDILGDVEGKQVLDLGAGTCRYSIELASKGAEVTAVDISPEMLEVGKKKAEKRGVRDKITFVEGDALSTDYEDDSFDIVTAFRLFHLIDDPEALLMEMRRVTKDRVLFDFFNLWSMRIFYNKFMSMDSKLRRKRKLKNMLIRNGFYNIRIKRDFLFPYGLYRFSPRPLPALYNKLGRFLGGRLPFKKLCSVIYMEARKS